MEIYKEFVVFPVDYKKKIVFLSTENVKTSWTFEVDWSFPQIKTKPKMFLESGNEQNGKTDEAENDDVLSIQHVAVSEANSLLAFTTSDKSLFLCRIASSSSVVLSRRVFLRTASIIKFSSCGKSLILSDKTGDTFEYSCEDVNKPGRWIFGHISQILDLQIKSDFSCIVTSDRDEKIRVTNYPATHEIQAFCVGHKEFVSSVAFFNSGTDTLLSVSGDKTLRLWNYSNGKQLQAINLDYVPIKVVSSEGLLAISSDNNTLYIYRCDCISPESVKIHLIGQKEFEKEHEFTGHGNCFFVKHIQDVDAIKRLLVDKVTITDGCASFELLSDVTNDLDLKLDSSFTLFKTFDVSLLFKKKFDNVKQYIDRKKARIENQGSKNK